MGLIVGCGGASRHSCVALCVDQDVVAACEQERVTRVRAAGPNPSGLPDEALNLLLERHGLTRQRIARVAFAEDFVPPPSALSGAVRIDHHLAHAATSYLASPVENAVVFVCDHDPPGTSVWLGHGRELSRFDWPWRGAGLAELYSDCAEAMGFTGPGQDQHLEALARLTPETRATRIETLFRFAGDSIVAERGWQSELELRRQGLRIGMPETQALASATQTRLGELLMSMLAKVREASGAGNLCLAGSLFSNSYFCGLAKRSKLFEHVFVSVNPGNAGLSVGTSLLAAGAAPRLVGPFLGPEFDAQETKATLDNCKLKFDWTSEDGIVDRAVTALTRGHLVGWFDGPMEYGPRALGGRSILASPFAPYVLENLNRFLKHRPPWRGYAMSVLEEDVSNLFEGPEQAPYMECDYRPRDPEAFREALPSAGASVRVQTVGRIAPSRFRKLLTAFKEAVGSAVLVNTSFNGFSEPMVCCPRDAVRVFYGTGLDVLVMDRFLLEK